MLSPNYSFQPKHLYTKNGTDVYKMAQVFHKWDKILELFYEYPNHKFTVREISKKTKIPSSSVQRYLQELKKKGFITKENRVNTTPYLKFQKALFLINKLYQTGLIEYLEKTFHPSAIILFGSIRKGEYDSESDIDIFVETTKKADIKLERFNKKLGHKIELFIHKNIHELPPELFNSVINGIKLSGYIKIK